MMKNYYILLIFPLFLSLWGCKKYLEIDYDVTAHKENVIESYSQTRDRIVALYTHLDPGFSGGVEGVMMDNISDNAEFTDDQNSIQDFNSGNWNAIYNPDDAWNRFYAAINDVNLFLEGVDSVNLDPYRLDPSSNGQARYKNFSNDLNTWKYEARFLRAFYFFQLVKRYGGIPLLLRSYEVDDDYTVLTRNSLEECFDFIVDECDKVAKNLDTALASGNTGRISAGVALTLKSVALLYKASDLYNDASWAGGYDHPELISLSSGNRSQLWKDAADAAKAVIDLNVYQLSANRDNLFGSGGYKESEGIFQTRQNKINNFEKANIPIGYELAEGGTTPTQDLVDAFEMEDGSTFDWNNPSMANDPYANRDPRLYSTVITNDVSFKNRKVEIWDGGLDGPGVPDATKTGYYLRKFIDEDLDLVGGKTSVHTWNIFRLAEVYLNYAEALNEYDPGNPDILEYMELVRDRAGMGETLPVGLSQSQMRERIRNEYRVEFAFEDKRIWNLRRWGIAPEVLGAPVSGVKVEKSGNTFKYTVRALENRVFDPKMNFYPIPIGEMNAMPLVVQNPLWN